MFGPKPVTLGDIPGQLWHSSSTQPLCPPSSHSSFLPIQRLHVLLLSLSILHFPPSLSDPPMFFHLHFSPAGKLCLQNEDLAKKSIIQMVRELHTSKHSAIRSNVVMILCDLAVRFSSRVDPYLSSISAALKDKSLLVRKQTLTLLARLLQEDYIKWKGPLFFHVVSTLVDTDMSSFSEFCLLHLLKVRHPGIFYKHFVECIFFLNAYNKHQGGWRGG